MTTIFKYLLDSAETTIELPYGAKPLRVDMQNGKIFLWAEVDTNAHIVKRTFEVFGTGHTLPFAKRTFLNTFFVQDGEYVFHAYERHE